MQRTASSSRPNEPGPRTTGIGGEDCFRYNNSSQIDLGRGQKKKSEAGEGGEKNCTCPPPRRQAIMFFCRGSDPRGGDGERRAEKVAAPFEGRSSKEGNQYKKGRKKNLRRIRAAHFLRLYRGPAAVGILRQTPRKTQPDLHRHAGSAGSDQETVCRQISRMAQIMAGGKRILPCVLGYLGKSRVQLK